MLSTDQVAEGVLLLPAASSLDVLPSVVTAVSAGTELCLQRCERCSRPVSIASLRLRVSEMHRVTMCFFGVVQSMPSAPKAAQFRRKPERPSRASGEAPEEGRTGSAALTKRV